MTPGAIVGSAFSVSSVPSGEATQFLLSALLLQSLMWLKVCMHWSEVTQFALSVPDSQPVMKGSAMKPEQTDEQADDMRPEYDFDFSKAERGRYAKRLKTEGSNLVLIDPELAKSFPDSASVNAALRTIVEFAQRSASLTQHPDENTGKRRAA
jgi:hypothetical protein